MKARYCTYIFALFFVAAIAACSNIDESDRFIPVEQVTIAKHVLLEDFTGQSCVNCPAATELIKDMQELYGEENLIAVGLYSGPFGQTVSGRLYPLTTETGNYYYDKLGISVQPAAMIDRHTVNVVTATWQAEVYNAIQEEAALSLEITNEYDSASRQVSICIEATGVSDVDGKLEVWLVEDGIVSWQYLEDGSVNDDYVHNHVFRAAVNDRDGEAFALAQGDTATRSFTYSLDEDWEAENMSVVAFVYDSDGSLQAAKAPIIASQLEIETNNE